MPDQIRIRSLADCPEFTPVLADWFRQEWPEHFRGWSSERMIAEYFTPGSESPGAPDAGAEEVGDIRSLPGEARASDKALPLVLVADIGGDPIATVMLRSHWRDSHRHLGPWMGGLYVQPKFRGREIARRLMVALHEEATRRGHTAIYGGTRNLGRFLKSLGWEFQEIVGLDKESLALFRWRPK